MTESLKYAPVTVHVSGEGIALDTCWSLPEATRKHLEDGTLVLGSSVKAHTKLDRKEMYDLSAAVRAMLYAAYGTVPEYEITID